MDPKLFLPACRRADNVAMCMLENLLELLGTAEESSLFEEGCRAERLTLLPNQRPQASLSTGAGGVQNVSRSEKNVCIGRELGTLPAVVAEHSDSLGEKAPKNLPGSKLVTSVWEGVRGL